MLNGYVKRARFREDSLASLKKFQAAELDVVRSEYELGVGNALPKEQLDGFQSRVNTLRDELATITNNLQAAMLHRKELETIVGEMFDGEAVAEKNLADLTTRLGLLEKALDERRNKFMKEFVGLPIIDAFAPKKLDQIWLPKLTINNNFRDVARFDRCINCHQGIDKTAPGSAIEPGYPHEQLLNVTMATPAEAPAMNAKSRRLTSSRKCLEFRFPSAA